MLADLRDTPISVEECMGHVQRAGAGGVALFVGVVRDENEGRSVTELEYSAYGSMARGELTRIAQDVEANAPGVRVAVLHRTGLLHVGDLAVVCAASAPHRAEAFEACRALIERVKAQVPIWKRERGAAGEAAWVGWPQA